MTFKEKMDIRKDTENVLRNMCAGRNYREWSDSMLSKICNQIEIIIENDLHGLDDPSKGRLVIDEEMVITAMIMVLKGE